MAKGKIALEIYVLGSVATLALAWWLWTHRHQFLAADLILISPFPCPPGFPC